MRSSGARIDVRTRIPPVAVSSEALPSRNEAAGIERESSYRHMSGCGSGLPSATGTLRIVSAIGLSFRSAGATRSRQARAISPESTGSIRSWTNAARMAALSGTGGTCAGEADATRTYTEGFCDTACSVTSASTGSFETKAEALSCRRSTSGCPAGIPRASSASSRDESCRSTSTNTPINRQAAAMPPRNDPALFSHTDTPMPPRNNAFLSG